MKVTVITAVFNSRATVLDALRSVAAQDHRDVEHIVIDGGSTDGTAELLREHRSEVDVLVSERDEGIYDALNKGLRMATGEAVGFLHADDVFAGAGVLSKVAERLSDSSVDAVYGDLEYVQKSDVTRVVRRWRAGPYSRDQLKWGWMPPHPTFYARRRVYERYGKFDTRFAIAADYDCMLRFLEGGRISPAYVAEVLVRMRTGGASNRSLANLLRKSREDYAALRANGVGGMAALVSKNLRKVSQFF